MLQLTERIIGCAMTVHRILGPGFLEAVYRNALAHELRLEGFEVRVEARVGVTYKDVEVGEYVCDLLVNEAIILELKAARGLALAHEIQLVHYLVATGLDVGLLVNFGARHLEFKRKSRLFVRT
jgi:GxxExxY protein